MNTFTKAAVGAGLAFVMTVSVAQAASLTSDQVSAILNLLKSFGAEQSVITNVEVSLTGGTPSTSQRKNSDDDDRGWKYAPGQNASTTPGIPGLGERRSATAKCILLSRNLSQGSQGDDVRELQEKLLEEGHFKAAATGFFGPVTAKALAEFQERYGIASSTNGGAFGPMTRKFFERRCNLMQSATTTQAQ